MRKMKDILERVELIRYLDNELNRKMYAYANILDSKDGQMPWPSDTNEEKCSPQSIRRTIILLREQLILLEREV